jgi:heme-degrading monooxygenase HmoA
MRSDNGGTEEELHRTSTMVVWESLSAWNAWREDFNALSDVEKEAQQKDYDAFVAKYNENTEVVSQKRWCML